MTANENSNSSKGNMKGVWNIVENDSRERPIWVRVGTAFVNRDGSLNVYLDSLPLNGKLHIRELQPRTEQ